jgi:hypothetical protein
VKAAMMIATTDAGRLASTVRADLWKRHLASIAARTEAYRPKSWVLRPVGAPGTWPPAASR